MIRGYAGKISLVTGAGLVIRLALLGYQPLWRDEAFTALAVQRPLGPMLDVIRNDSAPPLFYLLERVFAVVSTAPAMLRLLPALAGTAAIPIVAALGRRVARDTGGVWAAVIAAIAPALLVSSLDARMYVLATTLVLASTLCLLRALERPSPLRWALYTAMCILAVYTVYFAVFAVVAQVLTVWLLHGRRHIDSAILMGVLGVATVASLAPWIVVASAQLSHSAGAFWVPKLSVVSLLGGLEQFFTGPPLNSWVTGFAALRGLQLAGDLAGVLVLVTLASRRHCLEQPGAETARFLATAAGIGVGVMILASFFHPLEDGKYLSTAWAPMYPLLGAGLATMPWRRFAAGAAVVTTAVAAATAVSIYNPDTPQALASLPSIEPGQIIAAYPSEYLLVLYYGDGTIVAHTRAMAVNVPWFWGTAVYPPVAVLHQMPDPGVDHSDVFYVSEPGDPGPTHIDGWTVGTQRCWSGACVTMLSPTVVRTSDAYSRWGTGQEEQP